MRYLLCLLPLFLFSQPVKIATYNVQNLFDTTYQGTEYEEYIPGKHNWNRRMAEIKLNHTAEVICDLDADILGLQEIENSRIFQRLIQRLKRVGCPYPYSAITHKRGAPIQVALLSRYRIRQKHDIEVSVAPRVRNILEAEVSIGKTSITLFVNHWKSKAYKGYESKRIKYAKALQKRLASFPSHKEYILLGDFNSDYNAYLTLEAKLNDTGGKTGLSDILQTRTEEDEIVKAKKGFHYTLWKELPVSKRWSQKFYGRKSTPDQIVLPATLFDAKGIDYVNDSFGVFKADYLFTKRGYINAWRYKHGRHQGKGYSDHLPVFAYFDTHPYIKDENQSFFHHIKKRLIEYLYTINTLQGQIILQNVLVLFKRGNSAIIKQTPRGRGVMLYGCASGLEEGYRYDLLVDDIKSYKGLKEITGAYVLKKKEHISKTAYYAMLGRDNQQNEVIRNIVGTYSHRSIMIGKQRWPVHFKKRKYIPENGVKIKIDYAHLGYYKQLQLVVYSPKDFTVLE